MTKISIYITFFFLVGLSNQACGQRKFPYKLTCNDLYWGAAGLGMSAIAWHLKEKAPLISHSSLKTLEKGSINVFDRPACHQWSPKANHQSRVLKFLLVPLPGILLLPEIKNKRWKGFITLGIMYAEVATLNYGLTGLMKIATKRKRPYLYNPNIPLPEKYGLLKSADAGLSFYSGHTSGAFSAVAFLTTCFNQIYNKPIAAKIVTGAGIAAAGYMAFLRYKAGQHFPTDIITGAVTGCALGAVIPYLHKLDETPISFRASLNGVALTYKIKQ